MALSALTLRSMRQKKKEPTAQIRTATAAIIAMKKGFTGPPESGHIITAKA